MNIDNFSTKFVEKRSLIILVFSSPSSHLKQFISSFPILLLLILFLPEP